MSSGERHGGVVDAVLDGGEATLASVMHATSADPSIPLLAAVLVLGVILLRSSRVGEPRKLVVACEASGVTSMDEFDDGAQPRCPACATVMRDIDGGYECAWDGTTIDVAWVERPSAPDGLPGLRGG